MRFGAVSMVSVALRVIWPVGVLGLAGLDVVVPAKRLGSVSLMS